MALRSRPAIQRIDLGPGDRLFDAGEVIVKQFFSLRAGDVRSSAIDRRHGNLCGQKGAGSIGGVLGGSHWSSSCRRIPRSFPISSRTVHCACASFATSDLGRAQRHRRATTSWPPNNTLNTYESENVVISSLPPASSSVALLAA